MKYHYVYILLSLKDDYFYDGYTNNLLKRLEKHNKGLVVVTKNRTPFILIFFEAYLNQKDALAREKYFKSGWGRSHLKKVLKYYLCSKHGGCSSAG